MMREIDAMSENEHKGGSAGTTGSGLLAIWSTVASDFETDYLHWLTREHVFERVGTRGFRAGSVYRRRGSAPSEYLILYTLESSAVMSSAAYRERLDNPTPWTQRVMPQLQKFRRGGGTITAHAGHADAMGAQIAVARLDHAVPAAMLDSFTRLAELDRITRVRVMNVAPDATAISTREKSMRTSDEGTFCGVIVIDALDAAALDLATRAATKAVRDAAAFETYDLVFSFSQAHYLPNHSVPANDEARSHGQTMEHR
jgi:hypothetical protein